jgi:hypothetical protein
LISDLLSSEICTAHTPLDYISAGAFSPIFLVGETLMGAEKDANDNQFDPRKTVVLGGMIPKETAALTVLDALGALVKATDLGAEQALNQLSHSFGSKSRKFAVPNFASKNTKQYPLSSPGLVLSSSDGSGIFQQLGGMKISKAKELKGGLLMVELEGAQQEVANRKQQLAEDVSFPVKVLLQLHKQNRSKLRLPNPRFVAGGGETEIFRIDTVFSSRTINWRLLGAAGASGAQVRANPSSRQPIAMMSDFACESRVCQTRLATAYSLMGTENPNTINAEGVSLLPKGTFSNFLFIVFAQRDTELRFLCTRSEGGLLALEAALCHNVVFEIANRFDIGQVNLFRWFLNKAMAGHLVSGEDRRLIKKTLKDIIAKSVVSAQLDAEVLEQGPMVWTVCLQEEKTGDYFPPLHLEQGVHCDSHEWPELDSNLVKDQVAAKIRAQHHHTTTKPQPGLLTLHRAVEQTVMPLLTSRRVRLHELNAIVLSSPSVSRAFKHFNSLAGSEVSLLGTFFDERHHLFIFRSEVSAENTYEQVIVSTPQFEAKQQEVRFFCWISIPE